jgi:hypothetical protein
VICTHPAGRRLDPQGLIKPLRNSFPYVPDLLAGLRENDLWEDFQDVLVKKSILRVNTRNVDGSHSHFNLRRLSWKNGLPTRSTARSPFPRRIGKTRGKFESPNMESSKKPSMEWRSSQRIFRIILIRCWAGYTREAFENSR